MSEMTNENVARLLRGLTIAVGNRKNRILIYQFLSAEIRALHYSYGVGDGESYKRALTFLEECERFTLRSFVRKSAERHVEVTVGPAKRVFWRAFNKLNASPALAADLESSVFAIPPRKMRWIFPCVLALKRNIADEGRRHQGTFHSVHSGISTA